MPSELFGFIAFNPTIRSVKQIIKNSFSARYFMSIANQFIELDRRFTQYTSDETPERLAERSYLAALQGSQPGISWDELL